VSKAKATGAEAVLLVSRLNDAILLTREMVKQRWSPMAILSMGPGWYEDQYLKTLGKLSDGPLSFVPWYDPNKLLSKQLEAAFGKGHPGTNLSTNHVYTFKHFVAADAYKRRFCRPLKLADAIRQTNITNTSPGPGIHPTPKARTINWNFRHSEPRRQTCYAAALPTLPEWPLTPYDKRG
jgi:branched-chain amino acid transport system substrate-binding protein